MTRTDLPVRRLLAVLAPLPLVFPSFVGAFALLAALVARRPARRPARVVGVDPTRPEGFAGVAGAHAVHHPLRPPAGGRPAGGAAAVARGERPPARPPPAAVFGTVVLPQVRGRSGRGAAGLPLRAQRLRGGRPAALRHPDPGHLHQPGARPRPVGGAQPAAGGPGPGGGGRRAGPGPPHPAVQARAAAAVAADAAGPLAGGRRSPWWSAWVAVALGGRWRRSACGRGGGSPARPAAWPSAARAGRPGGAGRSTPPGSAW